MPKSDLPPNFDRRQSEHRQLDPRQLDIRFWSDFVRGLADPETEAHVELYLKSGAAGSSRDDARREVAALRRVKQLAETDRQLEPPAHAIRWVKALGSLRRPEAPSRSTVGLLDRVAMALSFDSWRTAEAGVRDFGHGLPELERQVSYEGEGFLVDLRIEAVDGRVSIVGQLMRDGEEAEPLAGVLVFLASGEKVLGSSRTGELGELQAEDLAAEISDVRFVLDDGRCLEIRLPDPRPRARDEPFQGPSDRQ